MSPGATSRSVCMTTASASARWLKNVLSSSFERCLPSSATRSFAARIETADLSLRLTSFSPLSRLSRSSICCKLDKIIGSQEIRLQICGTCRAGCQRLLVGVGSRLVPCPMLTLVSEAFRFKYLNGDFEWTDGPSTASYCKARCNTSCDVAEVDVQCRAS